MKLTPRLALLMTVPPLLWAGNAVVGRLVVGSVPPLRLNLLRWLLALALLLPLGWRAFGTPARRAEIRARLPHLLLLSLLGVGAYNALQYLALTTSTPLNTTLIASTSPLGSLLVGAVFYGVRPRGRELLGAALSLVGAVVVLTRGHPAALAQVHFVAGDLIMLVAVLSWSAYSWLLARPPAHMQGTQRPAWNWAEFLCVQIVIGMVWNLASASLEALWLAGHPPAAGAAAASGLVQLASPWQSPWIWLALLYVAVGPSILAYRAWGLGVAQAGPAVAAFFVNLTPLFAALLSTALLAEQPQGYHALAFALIVGGIAISSSRR
jgi:drug/metabolite transporter (DMT)-like permease